MWKQDIGVSVKQIRQLSRHLDTGGTAANDGHMQQLPLTVLWCPWQLGHLKKVVQSASDCIRIGNILREDGIFRHTRDTEGVATASWDKDNLVVVDIETLILQLIECWLTDESLSVKIDVDSQSLDILCMEIPPSKRLMCQSRFKQSASSAGQ